MVFPSNGGSFNWGRLDEVLVSSYGQRIANQAWDDLFIVSMLALASY